MKVHVAYASDGSLLGGTIIHEDAPAQCRIVASPDYLVSDFDVPSVYATLDPADMWARIAIDVTDSDHRLVICE
jgi:hypothetical protein